MLDAIELGFDRDTAYLAEIKDYETALYAQQGLSISKETYPMVINEYKNAVLMFNVSELKVWDKAQNDAHQLRNFYERNQSLYGDGSFEEQKGMVIADYQRALEKDWVTQLRNRYPVKVNEAELKKLAKL